MSRAAGPSRGIFAQLNYDLTGLARVKEGRKPEPTASVIDTQSVKTSSNVPLNSQGTDAAKKIVGRKRGILTDTIGLIRAVTVTAAGLSENALGMRLLVHLMPTPVTPSHTQSSGLFPLKHAPATKILEEPSSGRSPRISRVIDKSSGVIANCLVTLVGQRVAEQVSDKPRTYRLAQAEITNGK